MVYRLRNYRRHNKKNKKGSKKRDNENLQHAKNGENLRLIVFVKHFKFYDYGKIRLQQTNQDVQEAPS